MTIHDIVRVADYAYGDDALVLAYFEDPQGDHGDTLAKFIAAELRETYDKDATSQAQVDEAIRVMRMAENALNRVVLALVHGIEF